MAGHVRSTIRSRPGSREVRVYGGIDAIGGGFGPEPALPRRHHDEPHRPRSRRHFALTLWTPNRPRAAAPPAPRNERHRRPRPYRAPPTSHRTESPTRPRPQRSADRVGSTPMSGVGLDLLEIDRLER